MRATVQSVAIVLVLCLAAPARSQMLQPQGAEFQVNTFTPDDQSKADVAISASGAFVIVWDSGSWSSSGTFQDGSGYGVYGQRYDETGAPQGEEFRVNTTIAGDQRFPSVAMAADGRFLVVWASAGGQNGGGQGIYAQRYDAAGVPQGGEFRVNTSSSGLYYTPVVAMNAAGEAVIVWRSQHPGTTYGQRYDASGVAVGGEFRVSPNAAIWVWDVGMASDGSFVVVGTSGAPHEDEDVYAVRWTAAGTPAAPPSWCRRRDL